MIVNPNQEPGEWKSNYQEGGVESQDHGDTPDLDGSGSYRHQPMDNCVLPHVGLSAECDDVPHVESTVPDVGDFTRLISDLNTGQDLNMTSDYSVLQNNTTLKRFRQPDSPVQIQDSCNSEVCSILALVNEHATETDLSKCHNMISETLNSSNHHGLLDKIPDIDEFLPAQCTCHPRPKVMVTSGEVELLHPGLLPVVEQMEYITVIPLRDMSADNRFSQDLDGGDTNEKHSEGGNLRRNVSVSNQAGPDTSKVR